MTSLAFPITDEAKLSILKLQHDEINYVQLVKYNFYIYKEMSFIIRFSTIDYLI